MVQVSIVAKGSAREFFFTVGAWSPWWRFGTMEADE